MIDTKDILLVIILGYLAYRLFKWVWGKQARYIPRTVKDAVLKRYFGMCAVCEDTHLLEFHHKKEYSDGGDNSESNIVPLCPKHHAMVTRMKDEKE